MNIISAKSIPLKLENIYSPIYCVCKFNDDLETFRKNNKVDAVPVTTLIDSTGIVLKVWQGSFKDSVFSEIVATISDINTSINNH